MSLVTKKKMTSEAIEEFKTSFRGQVLQPGESGYDSARTIWNAMFDRKPALIARCAGVADVIRSVNFARNNEMLLAVRSGGHSFSGASVCEDGLVIDLSLMKGVRVDPENRRVRAEAGLTWGELDHETQAFGLAVTGGTVSHTGIGGLSLGGGMGWLMRKCGLTVDNILAVDIVTADGSFLKASATENADLYWGVRGGGGNFGIVTSFEYQLHSVGPVVAGGLALYPFAMARDVLKFYRDLTSDAPDELAIMCVVLNAPPEPFVPVEAHGMLMIALGVCYAGPVEDGMRIIERIRKNTEPALDMLGPLPYTTLQALFDKGAPFGWHYYAKQGLYNELSDGLIDSLVKWGAVKSSPLTVMVVQGLGGAVNRVGPEGTAFAHRTAAHTIDLISTWVDPAESARHIQWTREADAALQLFWAGGKYVNYLNDETGETIKSAYPSATYNRLVELKNKYDPYNLFKLNQNIKPAVKPRE